MKLRLFKTRHFADAASKAWICDSELREAFGQLLRGQADNLGGGVWLKENRHRSIVLAKGRHYWVYNSLFDKQRRSNISHKELGVLRALAKVYEALNEAQVQHLLDIGEFVEMHHDQKI